MGLSASAFLFFLSIAVAVQAQGEITQLTVKEAPTSIKSKTFVEPTEQKAAFVGGTAAWEQYVKNNLTYPSVARRNAVEGSVLASFQVNPDGEITNIRIEEALGFGCDEEVKRLLEASPLWQPAIQGLHTVKSKVKIAIDFKLQ